MKGVTPDYIGRFSYPEFSRYLSYYTNPTKFLEGEPDRDSAMERLTTYHDVQQELIRKAEAKKKELLKEEEHG